MGFTNFPQGITSFNVPVLPCQGGTNLPSVGQVFFVNNSTAPSLPGYVTGVNDNSQYGTSPQRPFATIQYAINQCKASNGDIVYVLGGHAESIIAAGTITVATAGVSIIGIPYSNFGRPTITLKTATTATFLVTAANVVVRNIKFDSTGIDAVAKCFDIQGAGFWLDNCEHYFAKTSFVTINGMIVDTAAHANNLTLTNNYIHGDAAANCTNWLQIIGGDGIVIQNNIMVGNFTTTLGPINNITAAVTNITINNNVLQNNTAASTKAIVLLTGSTGWVVNNRILILGPSAAAITADTTGFGGNYVASAVATTGVLV